MVPKGTKRSQKGSNFQTTEVKSGKTYKNPLGALIEILLRLSTAKYWSESHFISVRIAVLDISNDQKKL